MSRFIEMLKMLAVFLVGVFGIAASAGCLNYGHVNHEGFYTFVGILNFAIVAFADYNLYKILFPKQETKQAVKAKGAVSGSKKAQNNEARGK